MARIEAAVEALTAVREMGVSSVRTAPIGGADVGDGVAKEDRAKAAHLSMTTSTVDQANHRNDPTS